MKQKIFEIGIVAGLIVGLLIHENAIGQDKKNTKEEKHIKIVKVDGKGKKVEIDTIVTHGNVFIWNGDTIDSKADFKWQPAKGVRIDSIHKSIDHKVEYKITEGDDGKVIIMKGNNITGPMVYGFTTDGDSTKKVKVLRHPGSGHNTISVSTGTNPIEVQGYPLFPPEPPLRRFNEEKQSNKIDLSDPDIISYEKKKLKGGREKITIIRNEVKYEDVKVIHDGSKVIRIRENSATGGKTIDVNVETEDLKK